MKTVLLINGPNLGLLGRRQTAVYGRETLKEVEEKVKRILVPKGIHLAAFQHNVEGEIVTFLNEKFLAHQDKSMPLTGILINPGAYTHTSIAIRDALEMFKSENVPIFEVHISNIFARESFRHHSYVSSLATGVITGLGTFGYEAAALKLLEVQSHDP